MLRIDISVLYRMRFNCSLVVCTAPAVAATPSLGYDPPVPDHGELVMPVSHASAHHDAPSHAARMDARCLTLSSRQLISWSLKGDQ